MNDPKNEPTVESVDVGGAAWAAAALGRPELNAPRPKKVRAAKPWKCQECGKRFTTKGAERAMLGDNGCPGCGGSDIDLIEEV